jgi:hypothetical protein
MKKNVDLHNLMKFMGVEAGDEMQLTLIIQSTINLNFDRF